MESKMMYRCTGSCGGVSPVTGNCGAESCELHNHPLQKVMQCESCAAKTEADGKPHACGECAVA